MNRLWYRKPANDWNCALPLGNGFMGAMCFGGGTESLFRIQSTELMTVYLQTCGHFDIL